MASIDISFDYDKLQKKVESYKSYKDLKSQYDKVSKKTSGIFTEKSDKLSQSLNSISGKTKSFQKKVKNQLDELLDLNTTLGKNTNGYLKKKFIEALNTIEPQVSEILIEEIFKAIGCDQQQTYVTDKPVYVKVSSIDLSALLKVNPTSKAGKLLYEKSPLSIQSQPFSMNKELYQLTQTTDTYSFTNGSDYLGVSNQNLFDIKFLQNHPLTGVGGGWYEVTPKSRIATVNLTDVNQNFVGQFVQDYYKTIKLYDRHNVIAWTVDFITGAISITRNESDAQIADHTWLAKQLKKILGLCFDNRAEIDVSGVAKISQSDGIDESFFELDSIDLREIDQTVNNFKNGVFEFEDCDTVKLPTNTEGIIGELDKLIYVPDKDFINIANSLPETLTNDEEKKKNLPGFDIFDKEFLKQLLNGLVSCLLSPKVILPIIVMIKSISNKYDNVLDKISSFKDFAKHFKEFFINFSSRIFSLFIKILFNIIKRDIVNLVLSIIKDINIEKYKKKAEMILTLVKIFLAIAEIYKLITDWRKCKSIVDELLKLIQIWQRRSDNIPIPIMYAARLLNGYSETRAFIGTIEELQKLGIPTGAMPDGSPNLTVLSTFAQLKASAFEEAANGKVQVALGPLTITPAGVTLPANAYGKKF